MLNIVTNYYKKDKENLRDNAKDKYRILCEEEKTEQENMKTIDIIICMKKRKKS